MDVTAEIEFTITNLKTDHRLQALVDELLLGEIADTSPPPTVAADQWFGYQHPPTVPTPPMAVAPHLWSYPTSTPTPTPPPTPTVPAVPWFEHHISPVPTMPLPANVLANMVPVGVIHGELVYDLSPEVYSTSSPPPVVAPAPLALPGPRTTCRRQREDGRPYVKKPPNAFLLFLKDQRAHVVAELGIRDNAMVNAELGRRWTSLTPQGKDIYFQEAEILRRLHESSFPDWSTSDNYGKKKKRTRSRKGPTMVQNDVGHLQYLFPSHLHLQTPGAYTTALPPPV